MKQGDVVCADQGICYVEAEKEQLLYFIKPCIDVFAVPNSYLTCQLYSSVLFKHVLGHAVKGGEAVNRTCHLRGKNGLFQKMVHLQGLNLLCPYCMKALKHILKLA